MKKFTPRVILCITFVFFTIINHAQVGIGTTNPDASALLELNSSDKGILIPRMSHNEITDIVSPANGLMVFNTNSNTIFIYISNINQWKEIDFSSSFIALPSVFIIGSGGACNNSLVIGNYIAGISVNASNSVTIDIEVTTVGPWSIHTDLVNGYKFSNSGTFTTTGIIEITLYGTGTPTTPQADIFTIMGFPNTTGSCTFSVTSTTLSPCVNPISYGNQNYNIVQIGTQCWMTENLNIGTMINSGINSSDNAQIEKYCYDNNISNCNIYGGLYKHEEIMQYVTTESTQGICPTNWHIPSDEEWKTLEIRLGMSRSQADGNGDRGSNQGGKIKEINYTHWSLPNLGATNSSGFTAFGGGTKNGANNFLSKKIKAYFSTSTVIGSSASTIRVLSKDKNTINRSFSSSTARSLRCVRD